MVVSRMAGVFVVRHDSGRGTPLSEADAPTSAPSCLCCIQRPQDSVVRSAYQLFEVTNAQEVLLHF